MQKKASAEERTLILHALELPLLERALEHNVVIMKQTELKFGSLLTLQLETLLKEIREELRGVNSQLRKAGIKIFDRMAMDDKVSAKFLCRGHTEDIGILWPKVRSDLELRLADLLSVNIAEIQRYDLES